MNAMPENTGSQLSDEAIDWLVLLRSGAATAEDRRRFEKWRTSDSVRIRAFEEAEALMGAVARTFNEDDQAALPVLRAYPEKSRSEAVGGVGDIGFQRGATRRRIDTSAAAAHSRGTAKPRSLALAAALLLGVWMAWPQFDDRLFSDYATAAGEQREVVLADGSSVLLNTDSAISLDWSDARRRIVLRRGQAAFRVAADVTRPFEVESGAVSVRALGTVFEVFKQAAGALDVTVTEHAVKVSLPQRTDAAPVRVEAGQRLHYSGVGALAAPETASPDQATAWQRKTLIFRDRPLAEVVAELNRYTKMRILIGNADTAKLRVSGVFPSDDLPAVLEAVQKGLSIHVTRIGPWFVILHG